MGTREQWDSPKIEKISRIKESTGSGSSILGIYTYIQALLSPTSFWGGEKRDEGKPPDLWLWLLLLVAGPPLPTGLERWAAISPTNWSEYLKNNTKIQTFSSIKNKRLTGIKRLSVKENLLSSRKDDFSYVKGSPFPFSLPPLGHRNTEAPFFEFSSRVKKGPPSYQNEEKGLHLPELRRNSDILCALCYMRKRPLCICLHITRECVDRDEMMGTSCSPLEMDAHFLTVSHLCSKGTRFCHLGTYARDVPHIKTSAGHI